MGPLDRLWIAQPPTVKLFLIGQFALFVISLVRFVSVHRRVSRPSDKPIDRERIAKGEFAPELLAEFALGSRVLCKTVRANTGEAECIERSVRVEKVLYNLNAADIRFRYLWERCRIDVRSAKRAAVAIYLLSFLTVAYDFTPTFNWYFNDRNVTGSFAFLATADQLTLTLAFGLFLGAMLYLGSSFFDRRLAERNACWSYLCATLKHQLPRE